MYSINSESSPLLSQFIEQRLIQELPISESNAKIIARKTLKIAAMILAIVGNIAFVEDAYKCGGGNVGWSATIATCDTISYILLTSWILHQLIDEYLGVLSSEERALFQRDRIHAIGQVAIFGTALALSVFLSAPLALFYAEANKSGFFSPWLMASSVMAINTWLPIRSFTLLFQKELYRRCVCSMENTLQKTQNELLSLLDRYIDLVGEGQAKTALFDKRETSISSVTALSLRASLITKKSTKCLSIPLSALITITEVVGLGILAYYGIGSITGENLGAMITAAVGSVFANIYLYTNVIHTMTEKVCRIVKNFFSGFFQKNIYETLSPKLSFTLEALSLVIAILSYPTSLQMAPSFGPRGLALSMEVIFCIGLTLLLTKALLDVTHQMIGLKISRFGSEEAKALLLLDQKLRKLHRVIQKSPPFEVLSLIELLPEHAIKMIEEDVASTRRELSRYLAAHPEIGERQILHA